MDWLPIIYINYSMHTYQQQIFDHVKRMSLSFFLTWPKNDSERSFAHGMLLNEIASSTSALKTHLFQILNR